MRKRAVAVILFLFSCLCLEAFDVNDISFYLPLDGHIEPSIAGGSSSAVVQGTPSYDKGVHLRALVTNKKGQTLRYQVKGNLNPRQGSVAMWIKPLTWEPAKLDPLDPRVFFDVLGPENARLLIYKYQGASLMFLSYNSATFAGIGKWKAGDWHHIVCTWRRESGDCRTYIDGELAQKGKLPLPDELSGLFAVGSTGWGAVEGGDTLLDEFYIFRRALTPEEVANLYALTKREFHPPVFSVPRVERPPNVDGLIKKYEWRGATELTGFLSTATGRLSGRVARAMFAFSGNNLYVGFEVAPLRRQKAPPKVSHFGWNCTVELSAAHNGAEVPLILLKASAGERPLPITPKIVRLSYKSRIRGPVWSGEVSIPFAVISEKLKAGDSLKLNLLFRILRETISLTGTADDPLCFAQAHLDKKALAVKVSSLGNLADGSVDFSAALLNTGNSPTQYTYELFVRPSDMVVTGTEAMYKEFHGNFFRQSDTVTLSPQKPFRVKLKKELKDFKINLLELSVTEKGNKKPVFHSEIPFFFSKNVVFDLITVPGRGLLRAAVNLGSVVVTSGKSFSAAVEIRQNGRGIQKKVQDIPGGGLGIFDMDMGSLAPGKYEAVLTVYDKSMPEKIFNTQSIEFEKRPVAQWERANLGASREVPEPWTPIKIQGEKISMWGRTYDFTGGLLPVQITSKGKKMLAAPMELKGASAGKEGAARFERAEFVERSDDRIRMRRFGKIGPVPMRIDYLIEFDGYVKMTIVLVPEPRATLSLLKIVIPLKKEHATKFHHGQTHGSIREAGIDIGGGYLWIGDWDRCIGVFNETEENYNIKDGKRALTLHYEGRRAILERKLINTKTSFDSETPFDFGFIVTPPKPHTRPYQLENVWSGGDFPRLHLFNNLYKWLSKNTSDPLMVSFSEEYKEKGIRDFVESVHKEGNYRFIPWLQLNTVCDFKEYYYYLEEWKRRPAAHTKGAGGGGLINVCLKSSWRRALLAGINRLVTHHGIDGVYFDTGGLPGCESELHGCGYVDRDGKPRPTVPITAHRDFKRRLYNILLENKKEFYIGTLINGFVVMPVLTFDTSLIEGEQWNWAVHGDYTKALDLDSWAVEFNANQWGLASEFLPMRVHPPKVRNTVESTDTFLIYSLLNGTPLWPAYANMDRMLDTIEVLKTFPVTTETKFTQFFRESDAFSATSPAVKMSFYENPGKVLLIACNFGDKPITEKIRMKAEKLSIKDKSALTATDAITKEKIALTGNILTVPIKKKSYRMIVIE